MSNLSLFVAKLEKINGNESLQIISAPKYTCMHNRPLKNGFNHNIYWYNGPKIKIKQKNDQKWPKNAKFLTICRKIGKNP